MVHQTEITTCCFRNPGSSIMHPWPTFMNRDIMTHTTQDHAEVVTQVEWLITDKAVDGTVNQPAPAQLRHLQGSDVC
jgi:hypothetical protein